MTLFGNIFLFFRSFFEFLSFKKIHKYTNLDDIESDNYTDYDFGYVDFRNGESITI